jgi:serine/threonine protein kinase
MIEPSALPVGTMLGSRYRVESLLGRGGFAITYLARDLRYDLTVVIKELAPSGAIRNKSLRITFPGDRPSAIRLMGQFRDEVTTLRKLHIKGVIRPMEAFSALGTAYYVMPHFADSSTAEEVVLKSGPLGCAPAEELFIQLLKTLNEVHAQGVLHRDIKPSNILISADGDVFLIDFGSARQWLMDVTQRHTVEFTPGFAPIEQLTEEAKRGPGTDLYGLCATMFYLLTGRIPPVPGEDVPALDNLRPDIRPAFALAIASGLALRLADRPRDADEMLKMLEPELPTEQEELSFEDLDELLHQARKVKIGKLECPSCRGIVFSPSPAKANTCIVCRAGRLEKRHFDSRTCPTCKFGILHKKLNENPLRWCPTCKVGKLERRAKVLRKGTLTCQKCEATFKETKIGLEDADGVNQSLADWRTLSGRSTETWECDQCFTQLDSADDGRWVLAYPESKEYTAFYPDEWARIAAGADPGAGNLRCETCQAEYFADQGKTTLIHYTKDPFGTVEDFLGQVVTDDQMRWIAAGKSSGNPGWLCEECDTEFDLDGEHIILVHSPNPQIKYLSGESHDQTTWRRIALRLPSALEEPELETKIELKLREAWICGELAEDVFWKGSVTILEESKPITAGSSGITLGKLLRKSHHQWADFSSFANIDDESVLVNWTNGASGTWYLEPHEITIKLPRSQRTLPLTAKEFAERANRQIGLLSD